MTNKHFTLYSIYDIIIIEDIFVTTKEILKMTYEIIYNSEVIDTAETTKEACQLVKEYRAAFKSLNVWYKRGE